MNKPNLIWRIDLSALIGRRVHIESPQGHIVDGIVAKITTVEDYYDEKGDPLDQPMVHKICGSIFEAPHEVILEGGQIVSWSLIQTLDVVDE